MLSDLTIIKQPDGKYALGEPTTDTATRLQNRVTIQELSDLSGDRGSAFIQLLRSGRVKTSSDVVALFTASTAGIIQFLRTLSYDIYPRSIALLSYTTIDATTLSLKIAITGSTGNSVANITVSAT